LGDKKSIEKEEEEIELKIKNLKDKKQLSDEDLKRYQKISADLAKQADRIDAIKKELLQMSDITEGNRFFSELRVTVSPSLASLPKKLQEAIRQSLDGREDKILKGVNKQVLDYKKSIEREKIEAENRISVSKKENKKLIEKYQKNIELEEHVKKLNEHSKTISKITEKANERTTSIRSLEKCEEALKSVLDERKSLIRELSTNIDNSDQSTLKGIKFGVEYGFDENLEQVTQKINIKEKSKFIDMGKLSIDEIREKPGEFLCALYSGEQKINKGNEKKQIAREVLTLTEKILFNAEMEGDKIGGLSEPTMTPGKRALFLLRLILFESEDTWPLLIDQPEDDLDSRSIYDDIVPFLKEKKKERQIIMVSHNANLVIGSDSEQVIVANRHGTDRKNADKMQFNYLSGSLEYSKTKDENCYDTLRSQGVCEHSCEILDGGKIAFQKRKNKYNFK